MFQNRSVLTDSRMNDNWRLIFGGAWVNPSLKSVYDFSVEELYGGWEMNRTKDLHQSGRQF